MARRSERHPEGAIGEWFIDRRCIQCGASSSVAPGLVVPASDGKSVFDHQPLGPEELRLAQVAAELCPTRSIGTESRLRWTAHHPMALTERVWRCGSNAWVSAGANAYLVQRADGNLLIDAPRWSAGLADRLAALGGVADIVITHADDVADADRYALRFGAQVWIHESDRDAAPFASRLLSGSKPRDLAPGVVVVPTPGHTPGHVMVLIDSTILFSGDSLVWDPYANDLWAEEAVCWHSWPEQLTSLERLVHHRFEQVIPGHGASSPRLPADEMRTRLIDLLTRLRARPASAS